MRLTGDFRAAAVMTVNNIEAAIRLSAAGMGIAYVPDFVVREAMDEGQLQEVLPGCCVRMGISRSCGPPAATCHQEYAVLSILWLRQRYPCHPHRHPTPCI